jgi:hypothetical protein
MAVLTYTITVPGVAPWTVAGPVGGSTQAQAATYAAGGAVAGFSGNQHAEILAPRMRAYRLNNVSAGAAGSQNYGAYCLDPNYNLGSPRGAQFNVSAGV